jgi:hypothetical protein
MKKLSTLFVLISFIAVFGVLLSGCKKTENNPPTITITGLGDTYLKGAVDTFTVLISSNDGDLTTLENELINVLSPVVFSTVPADAIDGTSTTCPLDFKSGNHSITIRFIVNFSTAGQVTIKLKVTDSNEETAQETIIVTVTEPPTIILYTDVELGDQSSAVGSFYASYENEVYTIGQISSNYAKIDWIYYYDETTWGDAFYSPDDQDIQNQTWIGWANWTTVNSTKFVWLETYNFTYATWQDIQVAGDSAVTTAWTKAYDLQIGDIFGFRTADSKSGLLKINDVSGTVGGTVKFDVKILQ